MRWIVTAALLGAAFPAFAHNGIHADNDSPNVAVPQRSVIEQYARQLGMSEPNVRSDGGVIVVSGKVRGVAASYRIDGRSLAVTPMNGSPAPPVRPISRVPFEVGPALTVPRLTPPLVVLEPQRAQ